MMAQNTLFKALQTLSIVGVMAFLPACSGSDVSRAFGLERSMPDDYTVTTRPPLSMPPSEQLNLPGHEGRRAFDSPRKQALETLSPNAALSQIEGEDSDGQRALVSAVAKTSRASGHDELAPAETSMTETLMFWQKTHAGSVVDGEAENRRLRRLSALGQNPSTGATPTVRKKKSAFLGLF